MSIPKTFEFPFFVVRKEVLNRIQQFMSQGFWVILAEKYKHQSLAEELIPNVVKKKYEHQKGSFDT
jgi:hypothetical protein